MKPTLNHSSLNHSTHQSTTGKLYLVPAPLDFGCEVQSPITDVLPAATIAAAVHIRHWVCENAKSTRATLNRLAVQQPLICPLIEMTITELPRVAHKKGDHNPVQDDKATEILLSAALQGFDVGLMSEAGMPAIADPGSSVVRAAHRLGIEVVPLTGPISIMLALAASGLNGQSFAFNGYLPQDAATRQTRIVHLERQALQNNQAQIFIETPFRNAALLAALISGLQAHTRLSVSVGLSLTSQTVCSQLVKEWAADKLAANRLFKHKLPAVFAFG